MTSVPRPAHPVRATVARLKAALAVPQSLESVQDAPLTLVGKIAIASLIALPMIVTAILLLPEITMPVANLNDDAFHFALVRQMSDALAAGRNPLDVWLPELESGFPAAFYYQHLPHLFVALLDRLTLGAIDLFTLFNTVRWALLVVFPLTVFWSMRRMGAPMVAAAVAAAASPLLSGSFLYGFDYASYVWSGFGMFTQLWAMHLSFITLACAYRVINRGTGYALAIIALSLLVLSHLLYAYMMVITLILVVVIGARRATFIPRVARLAIVGGVMALVTSYQWLPWVTSSQFLNISPNLQAYKYDSFGAPAILGWLISGDLFDHGRVAVLTVLVGLGVVSALIYRTRVHALALVGFVVWLVLYFGRPTIGPIIDALPVPNGLLLHRFIGSVEIFAIILMGFGGALVWDLIQRSLEWLGGTRLSPTVRTVVAAGAIALILAPALAERVSYYQDNTTYMTTSDQAVRDSGLEAIIETLKASPPGRVYAGLKEDWGKQLKLGDLHVRDVLVFNGLQVAGPEFGGLTLNSPYMWYFRDQDQTQYDLVNARYVITPDLLTVPPFYRAIQQSGRFRLWEVPTSGATGYVAVGSRQSAPTQTDLYLANREWWQGPRSSAGKVIHWDYIRGSGLPNLSAGCPDGGKHLFESDSTSSIHVVVECPVPAALMFKVGFHPNWAVTVDGKPAETYMVSPSYVAVDLAAGKHDVQAVYTPSPVKIPLLVFGVVVLLSAVLFRNRLEWLPSRLGAIKVSRPRRAARPTPAATDGA